MGCLFEIKGLGAYSQASLHMHCSVGQCVCRGTCLEAVFPKKNSKRGLGVMNLQKGVCLESGVGFLLCKRVSKNGKIDFWR